MSAPTDLDRGKHERESHLLLENLMRHLCTLEPDTRDGLDQVYLVLAALRHGLATLDLIRERNRARAIELADLVHVLHLEYVRLRAELGEESHDHLDA